MSTCDEIDQCWVSYSPLRPTFSPVFPSSMSSWTSPSLSPACFWLHLHRSLDFLARPSLYHSGTTTTAPHTSSHSPYQLTVELRRAIHGRRRDVCVHIDARQSVAGEPVDLLRALRRQQPATSRTNAAHEHIHVLRVCGLATDTQPHSTQSAAGDGEASRQCGLHDAALSLLCRRGDCMRPLNGC